MKKYWAVFAISLFALFLIAGNALSDPPPWANGHPHKTPSVTPSPTISPTITPTPSPTITPSPTVTPTPSPTVTVEPQPTFPIRAAFYYPWFPETWGNISSPDTHYNPTLGFYDSSTSSVIKSHIASMQYGNIKAGIASWWGQGTKTDSRIPALQSAAVGTGFKWTLYYEEEGYSNPSASKISTDLQYIVNNYSSKATFLKVNNRPVIFVYADASDACGMADRWSQGNTVNAYIVLKVFSGYANCASQPASWHQYGPGTATQSHLPYSYGISPGFWHYNSSTPLLNRDLTRWNSNVRSMVASGAQWQLITTFNEWGEGTSVESATQWGRTYLDALHNNGVVSSPSPTTTPSPSPTSTTPSPTPTSTSPSPTPTTTTPPPTGAKYVFIWMENKETTRITPTTAPYMSAFAANGRNFTNFSGVTHPSLPNYLAFASGGTQGKTGTDSISPGEISANNVWNQLTGAGITWKAYQESMPSTSPPCLGNSYTGTNSGQYALKHNPATPFSNIFRTAQCANVVPLTQLNFAAPVLPQVSFITPNLCNDMHDCSVATGDTWLSQRVPQLLAAGATVIITFDEGETSTNGGGRIWTAEDGPGIGPSTNITAYNHYSALAGLEQIFGLTKLGGASSANVLPMT